MELMDEEQMEEFNRELEIDFAISKPGLGTLPRQRLSPARRNIAMVHALHHDDMPDSGSKLGMPSILKELVMFRRGLILMVGATGCGKSTTLAGMINYRNERRRRTSSRSRTRSSSCIQEQEIDHQPAGDWHRHEILFGRALKSAMRERAGRRADRRDSRQGNDAGRDRSCRNRTSRDRVAAFEQRARNAGPDHQHVPRGSIIPQVYMDLSQYLRAIISQRLVRGVKRRSSTRRSRSC